MERINKIRLQRSQKLSDLPSNHCAYISILDHLRGAEWLKYLEVEYNDVPILAPCLRSKPIKGHHAAYGETVRWIGDVAKQMDIDLNQREDPWVVNWVIRRKLREYESSVLT